MNLETKEFILATWQWVSEDYQDWSTERLLAHTATICSATLKKDVDAGDVAECLASELPSP